MKSNIQENKSEPVSLVDVSLWHKRACHTDRPIAVEHQDLGSLDGAVNSGNCKTRVSFRIEPLPRLRIDCDYHKLPGDYVAHDNVAWDGGRDFAYDFVNS